jgi:hypothetical protein
LSSVICTSYFSVKPHPNDIRDKWVVGRGADGHVESNSFKYIEPWYESVNSLGVEGRVFHDNLDEDFIKKYSTDKISFIKVATTNYSNNDWRFFCYRDFLAKNVFDFVFLTDGSDVSVVKNPEDIAKDFPEKDFFVCKDTIKLFQLPYSRVHIEAKWDDLVYLSLNEKRLDLINMGVIGGSYENIMLFLEKFCETRVRLGNPDFNSDMWVGQYVFRSLLKDKDILIGEPFTSEFKKYQNDRKDVYFIHK